MKVDGIEIVIESDAKKAIAELDKLIAKLGQASTAMQSVKGMKNASTGVKGTTNSLKSYTGTANKAAKSTFSLASAFGKFYASCFLVIRGIKAIGRAVSSSMDYIETYNYFNVITQKIGAEFGSAWKENGYSSAEEYANSFKSRLTDLTTKMTGYKIGAEGGLTETSTIGLGLDPEAITNFEASIASITNAVGLIGEASISTSTALTMLSADMSSLKNVDLQTVMTNFQSGLIGQSRALYKYGIDITNTKLAEYALAEGISKKVSEMTQAEKMQLRMIAILDQSKVAYGDMANTINSVANQYRVLKQQVSNLARTFGNLFVPLLQSALPIINGITIALTRMFSWIGTIIYGSEKWKKIMDGVSKGYSDTGLEALGEDADDTTGAIEDTSKAVKELKGNLQGFDKLNIVSKKEDTGTDTNVGGGGIDLSGKISDSLLNYQNVWDKALTDMESRVQSFVDKITRFFAPLKEPIEKIAAAIGKLHEALTPFRKGFGEGFTDFFELLVEIGAKVLEDIAEVLEYFGVTVSGVPEDDLESLGYALGVLAAAFLVFKVGGVVYTAATSLFSLLKGFKTIGKIAILVSVAIWGFEIGKELGIWIDETFGDGGTKDYYLNFKWTGTGGFFDIISRDWQTTLDGLVLMLTDFENNPVIATLANIFVGPLISGVALVKKYGTDIVNDLIERVRVTKDRIRDFESIIASVSTIVKETVGGIILNISTLPSRIWLELNTLKNKMVIAFNNIKTDVLNIWNKIVNDLKNINIPTPHFDFNGETTFTLGSFKTSIPKFKVNWYESGGFPDTGEMFVANESGIEMMGKMGSNNVVANNTQIVEGISAGVQNGLSNANYETNTLLRQLISAVRETGSTIEINGREVFTAVKEENTKYKTSTGKSAFA